MLSLECSSEKQFFYFWGGINVALLFKAVDRFELFKWIRFLARCTMDCIPVGAEVVCPPRDKNVR